MRKIALVLVASSGLAACQVGPDFKAPAAPGVARFTAAPLPATTDSGAGAAQAFAEGRDVAGDWWTLYRSPALDALMDHALKANADLAAARAALKAAHETYLAQRGTLLPTVDANFNPTRQKISQTASSPLNSNADEFSLHTAQVSVGYTPDVFGGLRRQVENAGALADAQRFQTEAVYLTLTANVVAAAVQQASLAEQVKGTRAVIASQRRALTLMRAALDQGEIARPDVAAQETLVAQTEQTLPPLQKQLAQQNDLLAALTGRYPSETGGEAIDLSALRLPAELPVSLPSALVRQRPDILAAEANLHAASAAVGVAIAARLPTFSLTANAGGQSTSLASLFGNGNDFWTLAGNVAQPVFEGGQLLHKQRAAQAQLEQAQAQYRSTVLVAFQNVADSLEALQADARTLQAAEVAKTSADQSLELAQQSFQAGETASLAVLSAEQAQAQAQLAAVQAQAARLADTAALFQALGGGWWNRAETSGLAQASAGGGAIGR
jgi:NodT family efflux transporter outer membrane factor (OMF) lipoprotein